MYSRTFKVEPHKVFETLEKWILRDGFDIVVDMEKSLGSHLVDARSGEEWLDFYTFFASSPFGMNHPALANEDFKEKIFRASINKVANSDVYTREMAEFVETFANVAVPPGFTHLFFVDYGTLAVENAFKVAMDWKVRKLLARGKISSGEAVNGSKGTKVLHFHEAFHGRGGYTLSVTNTLDPNKYQYFAKFCEWPRVLNPKIQWPLEENLDMTEWLEEVSLKQIHKALQENPDDICAIILEPIQGEGGDNHFRTEFLQKLREICHDHELLLIFDEVQCGMGITGKMWAWEHHGVRPDIFVFGKKAQVCGICATSRIDEVEENCFSVSSRINSTWGGTLADMVRSTRYLEIYEEENVLEYVAEIAGPRLLKGLKDLREEFPSLLRNVRGKGLMCAYDLPDTEMRNRVLKSLWEKKVLILPCQGKTIRYRPALNVSPEDLDRNLEITREILKKEQAS